MNAKSHKPHTKTLAILKKTRKMKTMTCRQLGGACEKEFNANTFEDISEMSKQHGMDMFQKKDEAHLEAMNRMRVLMETPDSEAMKNWIKKKRDEFNALPDSE